MSEEEKTVQAVTVQKPIDGLRLKKLAQAGFQIVLTGPRFGAWILLGDGGAASEQQPHQQECTAGPNVENCS